MYILFDIGGTKMRVVGSEDLMTFSGDPVVLETPISFDDGIILLKETIKKIAGDRKIEMIGGGIAGPVDQTRGCIVGGRNLLSWFEKPLRKELEDAFGVSVYIENDAVMVGLGEMHRGAGSRDGVGAYITVSTGVGGARFEDGAIDMKALGFEPGAEIIDPDKTMCPDCESGELESYIGGAATERRMGKKPYEILNETFWDTYAKYLAYGLNNIIALWSPHVIVLGGSMILGTPAISLKHTEKYLKELLSVPMPEIKKATLGDFGGLYGAMEFLKQEKK
jgi:glucokinase